MMSASSKQKGSGGKSKLRGLPKDSPEVRVSKTLSWILRHGAKSQGLYMRPDGFVRVSELLDSPKLKDQLDFNQLQKIVKDDQKMRYTLLMGPDEAEPDAGDFWWIRANQGHSMKAVKLDLKPILSATEVPMAVHGTNRKAWQSISQQGLSKMNRNHIHLAQGIGSDGVISGMRSSAQILIYIDVQKALDDGILFFLSENGVVLTEGDSRGFLDPKYFSRVESRDGRPIEGWQPSSAEPAMPAPPPPAAEQTPPAEEVKEAAS